MKGVPTHVEPAVRGEGVVAANDTLIDVDFDVVELEREDQVVAGVGGCRDLQSWFDECMHRLGDWGVQVVDEVLNVLRGGAAGVDENVQVVLADFAKVQSKKHRRVREGVHGGLREVDEVVLAGYRRQRVVQVDQACESGHVHRSVGLLPDRRRTPGGSLVVHEHANVASELRQVENHDRGCFAAHCVLRLLVAAHAACTRELPGARSRVDRN